MPRKKVEIVKKPGADVSTNMDEWVTDRKSQSTSASRTPSRVTQAVTEPSKEKTKRLTLDLPESLHRALKLRSVDTGEPMAECLRRLIEKELQQ